MCTILTAHLPKSNIILHKGLVVAQMEKHQPRVLMVPTATKTKNVNTVPLDAVQMGPLLRKAHQSKVVSNAQMRYLINSQLYKNLISLQSVSDICFLI